MNYPIGMTIDDPESFMYQLPLPKLPTVNTAYYDTRCYDCYDQCTKDFKYYDLQCEDGDVRVPMHDLCYTRATNGGMPVYPERQL